MITHESIKRLRDLPEWHELTRHIEVSMLELDRVSDIEVKGADAIATETLGRKRALEVLKAILEPFGFAPMQTSDLSKRTASRSGLNL